MSATPPVRAALYLRQSLDLARDGLAIDRQREACQKIAAERGWTVVAEYADNSISAYTAHKKRPGYDELCQAYRNAEFEALICWDLDRLTRQPRQLEDWIDAATERGLLLVTANGEADLSTDAGRLFARIKASVARAEVERKGARQRAAAQQRAQQGRAPLGIRPTGYTRTGDVIPSEAAIVRQVFERFAAGDSLRALALWLEESGVPTRRGGRWNQSSVRGILLNPRYAGRSVYMGKTVGPATWDPIVSEDLFEAVQAKLSDPRRRTAHGTHRRHLGSGLYECAVCGGKVTSWTGGRYRCRQACVNRSQHPVDSFVVALIRQRLARPDLADLLPIEQSEEATTLARQAKQLRGRLAQIEVDYDAGHIDGRRYAVATEKVQAELSTTEAALARVSVASGAVSVLNASDPVAAFDDAPLMIRRNVVDALCVIRLGRGTRGAKQFDPWTIGRSQWIGDSRTWGEHWEAEGLPPARMLRPTRPR